MFAARFKIFRLAGFDIYLDVSWFIIALMVTWSLASHFFPNFYPELRDHTGTLWMMGIAAALLFFASIVAHELGHAIAARRFGLHIRGITLFIFGGVAELNDEPPTAKSEFAVAVAGPIVSVALGFGFLALTTIDMPLPVHAVCWWLGFINLVLVVFNMVPAFPLDGGRMLRAALWGAKDNLRWATRVTSRIGEFFGIALIVLGVVSLFTGNLIGGVWWMLIGLFLRRAAQMSYQQVLLRRALQGETVSRFMKTHPIVVHPDTTITDLVEKFVYTHHHKMYPVTTNGHLMGCVSTSEIKRVPREDWSHRRVGDVIGTCTDANTVHPDTDAMQAMAKMSRTGVSRLLVVDHNGELVGIVTLKDLMRFMALKVEMED